MYWPLQRHNTVFLDYNTFNSFITHFFPQFVISNESSDTLWAKWLSILPPAPMMHCFYHMQHSSHFTSQPANSSFRKKTTLSPVISALCHLVVFFKINEWRYQRGCACRAEPPRADPPSITQTSTPSSSSSSFSTSSSSWLARFFGFFSPSHQSEASLFPSTSHPSLTAAAPPALQAFSSRRYP